MASYSSFAAGTAMRTDLFGLGRGLGGVFSVSINNSGLVTSTPVEECSSDKTIVLFCVGMWLYYLQEFPDDSVLAQCLYTKVSIFTFTQLPLPSLASKAQRLALLLVESVALVYSQMITLKCTRKLMPEATMSFTELTQ